MLHEETPTPRAVRIDKDAELAGVSNLETIAIALIPVFCLSYNEAIATDIFLFLVSYTKQQYIPIPVIDCLSDRRDRSKP